MRVRDILPYILNKEEKPSALNDETDSFFYQPNHPHDQMRSWEFKLFMFQRRAIDELA